MTPVFRKTTDNAEAYRRYLQGRYEWSKCTQDGFRRSIDYFREAIHPDRTMLRLSAFRLVTMNPTRGNNSLDDARLLPSPDAPSSNWLLGRESPCSRPLA